MTRTDSPHFGEPCGGGCVCGCLWCCLSWNDQTGLNEHDIESISVKQYDHSPLHKMGCPALDTGSYYAPEINPCLCEEMDEEDRWVGR